MFLQLSEQKTLRSGLSTSPPGMDLYDRATQSPNNDILKSKTNVKSYSLSLSQNSTIWKILAHASVKWGRVRGSLISLHREEKNYIDFLPLDVVSAKNLRAQNSVEIKEWMTEF